MDDGTSLRDIKGGFRHDARFPSKINLAHHIPTRYFLQYHLGQQSTIKIDQCSIREPNTHRTISIWQPAKATAASGLRVSRRFRPLLVFALLRGFQLILP